MATGFTVKNGQIIDPTGAVFIAKGLNMGDPQNPTGLLRNFPNANFVRMPVGGSGPGSLPDPSTFTATVAALTAQHILVELEDHPWPLANPYTGSDLTTECAWYAAMATAFIGNPYVCFGTMNEPQSAAGMQAQVMAIYAAIRSTGSNALLLMEAGVGGGNPGTVGNGATYNGVQVYASQGFTGLTNVVWDYHFYPWPFNYATDLATNMANLEGSVATCSGILATTSITSADGVIPCIIAECGPTTGGISSLDMTALTVAYSNTIAVNMGAAAAWLYYESVPQPATQSDYTQDLSMTDENDNLTDYGTTVAGLIGVRTVPTPVITPSPNNTAVLAGSTAAITDAKGNRWTITSGGQVAVNGVADATTANVTEIAYVNGNIWQENTSKMWWNETSPGSGWLPANGTPTSPLPAPAPPPTVTVASVQAEIAALIATLNTINANVALL